MVGHFGKKLSLEDKKLDQINLKKNLVDLIKTTI